MENKEAVKEMNIQRICLAALFGSVLAMGSCCILLLLFSAAIAAGWLPEGMMNILALGTCFLGVLMGGIFAVRMGDGPPLILGLSTGLVMCLLMLLVSITVLDAANVQGGNWMGLVSAMAGGGAAGLCKSKKQARRKARRR